MSAASKDSFLLIKAEMRLSWGVEDGPDLQIHGSSRALAVSTTASCLRVCMPPSPQRFLQSHQVSLVRRRPYIGYLLTITQSESEGSLGDTLFYIAFWTVFLIIVFSFLRSVFFPPDQAQAGGHDDGDDQPPGGPQPFFNDGYDGPDDGYDPRPGFRGGGGGPQDPPPPYTPRSKPTHQPGQAANTGGAGFWTGLLAGGLGTQALNGTGQPRQQPRARRGRRFDEDTFGYVDRGEGSSTGVTRTSTGCVLPIYEYRLGFPNRRLIAC